MARMTRAVGLLAAAVVVTLVPACASGADESSTETPSSAATRSSSAATSATTSAAASSATASSSAASSASSSAARGSYALFFGDSNFVGGGCTPDAQQDMARVAGDLLGYRSVIRGEGGTGFATGNTEFGLPNFLGQVRRGALDMSPSPRLVVVEGGSNDAAKASKAARNAKRVIRAAQEKYPDALVVLMGPIDVRAGTGDVRPRIVPLLQGAADRVGVPFLNAYDWLPWRTQGGLVCSDYDHATLAGHQIVGRTLADQLRDLGA